jgi:hypothetical protein
MIGLIFMSFAPLFYVASPDKFGIVSCIICAIIGLIFGTLSVIF